MTVTVTRRTLDDLLAAARARIVRYTPTEAHKATQSGALLIDIRSDTDRARNGIVPGSLHIPRTVLEWRADLDSPWRNHRLEKLDQQLILICDHGYATILAAAVLTDTATPTPATSSAAMPPGRKQTSRPRTP